MSVRQQQVQALYRAALERPAAERAAFIADLTGEDLELRRSVELLLSNQVPTDVGRKTVTDGAPAEELPAGTSIGQYRIDSMLGRGGMGVVYRATDTKLHRPVAAKFLAAAVAESESRRRFEQEARTTSALNHPHIVTVFDVGEHDGRQFIVSELVDGGTLDEWSRANRARTWRQSVELMIGVADALAAAHSAGVVHRDVKPGNILIGRNGYAKLADFGLAKLLDNGGGGAGAGNEAARTTRAGVVLGTVAYMSPEQAAGQPLDARTDVFSFGVVLYELLAGRRPFEGANDLEILKSIAHASPPPLPDTVPEPLHAIVEKALEKAPADRYQTMQDLVVDLRRVTRKHARSQAAGAGATERLRVRQLTLAAAGLGLALAAALVPAVLYFVRPTDAPAARVRAEIPAPGIVPNGLAVSPNGTQIAYTAVLDGVRRIVIRPLGSLDARALSGTEGAEAVFWSPDNERLAFVAGGKLKTVGLLGGPARIVADYSPPAIVAGAWTRDDQLFVTALSTDGSGLGIARIAASGGTYTPVSEPDIASGEFGNTSPRLLPDGEHFLYLAGSPAAEALTLYVQSLATSERVRLTTVDTAGPAGIVPGVEYADGFLLYRRDGTLFAQRFDPAARALHGEAVPIAERVAEFAVGGSTLVYRTSSATANLAQPRRLVWRDRAGQRLGELETPLLFRLPVLSPDERRVAVSMGEPSDVWTVDVERGVATRLTFHEAADSLVAWSPDSSRVVFNTGRDATPNVPTSLYVRAANGTGAEEQLFAGLPDEILVPFDWSPDGRYLVFGRAGLTTWQNRIDLWLLEMTDERTAQPLIESPFRKETATFSPDGRFIAYSSNEQGDHQIFVQPFPDLARGKWQVSTRGGREPHWRGDGQELFYLAPNGDLMAVELRAEGDTLNPVQPQPLFATGNPLQPPSQAPDLFFNVTADGQRFLVNELNRAGAGDTQEAAPPAALHVVVNWAAGL